MRKFLGIIVENFPNMEKEIVNQVQKAQRVPYRINPRRNTPRNIQTVSTNLTLYKAYTSHWTNLRREETKRKKELNLEVREKETSNTIS